MSESANSNGPMNEIKIPSPEEIVKRLNACRQEAAALKKLLKLFQAAAEVEEARRARQPVPGKEGSRDA